MLSRVRILYLARVHTRSQSVVPLTVKLFVERGGRCGGDGGSENEKLHDDCIDSEKGGGRGRGKDKQRNDF